MARLTGFPTETFAAMEHIRETTLVRFDSLFTPERTLWNLQNLQRFHDHFVERFEEGEGSFLDKFRKQLEGADDEVCQLAAELLYVQQFFTSLAGPEKKIENVRAVLGWSTQPVPIPEWAVAGLKHGLAGDQSFNQHRPYHLAWLDEFLIHWHSLSEADQHGLLADPWRFAQEVRRVEFSEGAYQPMQEAWLYMIFPDEFENISSRMYKKAIREAFKDKLREGPTDNIDRDLLEIRKHFATQEGEGFHFYRSPLVEQWRTEKGKTKKVLRVDQKVTNGNEPSSEGKRYWIFQANPKYYDIGSAVKDLPEQTWLVRQSHKQIQPGDTAYIWESGPEAGIIAVASILTHPAEMDEPEEEKRFCLKEDMFAGKQMRVLLKVEQVLARRISRNELKRHPVLSSLEILAFANATNFRVHEDQAIALKELVTKTHIPTDGRVWIEKTLVVGRPDRESGNYALGQALWSPREDKRGADIYHWMREVKPGDFVLHLTDNEAFTGLSLVQSAYEEFDGVPGTVWGSGPSYLVKLHGFKKLEPELKREEFFAQPYQERFLSLLDSADQSVFYNRDLNLNQGAYLTPVPISLLDMLNEVYLAKAGRPLLDLPGRVEVIESPILQAEYSLSQCASDTHIEAAILSRWVRALDRKGQIVLYGPPGTSKTYVAERLAQHLVSGSDGFVELVQFHPSYAYEDFIQGMRPQALKSGGLEYAVVPGRFLDFCEKAQRRKGRCVLIVDEINRANVSRVFGELMYLLEYRDRDVALSAGGRLRIPGTVRLIGTMNTADRSIALVDHALRRRFAFVEMRPDYELLRQFHSTTGLQVEGLITTLKRLTAQINDRHYEVGVTFFLKANLDDQIEDIWTMEIEPYLEEYFFDQPDTVEEFRWLKVASEIK